MSVPVPLRCKLRRLPGTGWQRGGCLSAERGVRGCVPKGEAEFQHVHEGGEEVGSVPPGCDIDVVGHWLASSSVIGDPGKLDCLVDEGQLWVVLCESKGHGWSVDWW